jgi:hypothetical protein
MGVNGATVEKSGNSIRADAVACAGRGRSAAARPIIFRKNVIGEI